MGKKKGKLTYRKRSPPLRRIFYYRTWLQNEYPAFDEKLLSIRNAFQKYIIEKHLSKLSLSYVKYLYCISAQNVILNHDDVKIYYRKSISKPFKGNQCWQKKYVEKLQQFILDYIRELVVIATNKITLILNSQSSIKELLTNHVWFNNQYQEESNNFRILQRDPFLFIRCMQLDLLSSEEIQEECAISVWNSLIYKTLSDAIRLIIPNVKVEPPSTHEDQKLLEPADIKIEPPTIVEEEIQCNICPISQTSHLQQSCVEDPLLGIEPAYHYTKR